MNSTVVVPAVLIASMRSYRDGPIKLRASAINIVTRMAIMATVNKLFTLQSGYPAIHFSVLHVIKGFFCQRVHFYFTWLDVY